MRSRLFPWHPAASGVGTEGFLICQGLGWPRKRDGISTRMERMKIILGGGQNTYEQVSRGLYLMNPQTPEDVLKHFVLSMDPGLGILPWVCIYWLWIIWLQAGPPRLCCVRREGAQCSPWHGKWRVWEKPVPDTTAVTPSGFHMEPSPKIPTPIRSRVCPPSSANCVSKKLTNPCALYGKMTTNNCYFLSQDFTPPCPTLPYL